MVACVFSMESQQVFALGFQERVAFGGFLVLLQRHHVDRTHGIQSGAHLAIACVFRGQLFAGDARQ